MSKIPIVIKREPDELLYSWILRLSEANGFTNLRSFTNGYITPNATKSEKNRRVLKYDLLEEYENIYEVLDVNIGKLDLFLETGVFSYYSLFMTSEQQASIVDESFYNNGKNRFADVSKIKMISNLNLCPECMKEDKKRIGRFYYHRKHQLPGVSVCAKHKRVLQRYKGIPMHEGDEEPKVEDLEYGAGATFAEYSAAILNEALHCNADDLKAVICKKLVDSYCDTYEKFKIELNERCVFKMSDYEIRRLWRNIHSEEYFLSPEKVVCILMILYPDVNSLFNVLQEKDELLLINDALKTNSCSKEVLQKSSIIEIEHKCGRKFCINPKEFSQSWPCPICEVSENLTHSAKMLPVKRTEENFRQLIRDLTGEEYTLISSFETMTDYIEIKHNVCGCVGKYKASDFAKGRRCKKCTQMLRRELLEDTVLSLSNGKYKLGSKRTSNLYTVIDTESGFSRDMEVAKILQELRRPTPSSILPLSNKGKETNLKTQVGYVWGLIEKTIPHGTPIFLEDIAIEGYSYSCIKRCIETLVQKRKLLTNICPGVYEYREDDLSPDEVVYHRYIARRGRHIGYYSGNNALYYLGIIKEKPKEFRVVTNKETSNNKSGRTTKFLNIKLRIRGSAIEITDENWKILMILDLATNIKKYMKGGDVEKAYEIMSQYVKENDIKPDNFSKYQNKYAFSYNAIRKLYQKGC